jgi:Rrf2 family protein
MLDLAQNYGKGYISLKSIAERQDISMKYLEMIVAVMARAGLVKSQRGKDGGYMLTREPEEYSAGEILTVTEGGLATVSCPECGENSSCQRAGQCLTYPLWQKLTENVNEYLNSVTLKELMEKKVTS